MKSFLIIICLQLLACSNLLSQNFPWERPLKMAWSADGTTFDPPSIFQDSSGVPSVIRWKGDTLICAFQWFRLPLNSPSWDKVAVKFSYDKGLSWTTPVPVIINGIPAAFQRPFDPTLALLGSDSIRIYFSSSDGIPQMGLDCTVNTYSAKSADGIQYDFEPNARVDDLNNRVIDPAVIYFNNSWHYTAPIGSPQQGAYHYVSPDGLNFLKVPDIPSDNTHNWTGNMMINDVSEMRFYGASPNFIWYNSTANGGVWNGYTNTNIQGGDPGVVKIDSNKFLMVYVGEPYAATALQDASDKSPIVLYPNPGSDEIIIEDQEANNLKSTISLFDHAGRLLKKWTTNTQSNIVDLRTFSAGQYFIKYENERRSASATFLKK